MLARVLEPEAMDLPQEARDYDAMDHREVNARFVADFLQAFQGKPSGPILDVGTGTARIPIALCERDPSARVVGIDVAEAMLALGRINVEGAGLSERIRLERHDARRIDAPEGAFAAVVSNTIIHHIPEPRDVVAEMIRLVAPGGLLFVRDLARPGSQGEINQLVEMYANHEMPAARRLFADSLHAALTLEEVRRLLSELGLPPETAVMTSDRHWTASWTRLH
jgi:ubiquinone/menaquinone biosynthesis C-methylase UbiE